MRVTTRTCVYCEGNGYVQLLLGGTERCYMCGGTGQTEEEEEERRDAALAERANFGRCCS